MSVYIPDIQGNLRSHMIRADFPEVPIIATGGPNEDSIRETIEAGANAITYTPPTNGEIFKTLMEKYRTSS